MTTVGPENQGQISEGYYETNHQQLSELSREDILRQVFGDVGELIDDFSCAVETTVLLHGRMYLTSRFLCFYSNLFGLEKKIRIPYSHITIITKENTALVIPNAIAIRTYRKEYTFRSFWDRDECYRILKNFIDAFKKYGQVKVRSMSANGTTQSGEEDENVELGGGGGDGDGGDIAAMSGGHGQHDPPRPRSVSESNALDRRGENPLHAKVRRTDQSRSQFVATVNDLLEDGDSSVDDEDGSDSESVVSESGLDFHDDSYSSLGHRTPAQILEAFNEEVAKSQLRIKVASKVMAITVGEFAELFVEDNAVHSLLAYHELVNDSSLECSPWKVMRGNLGKGRELKFFKPVNLPGLKYTRGVKLQRYRRFGDGGLVVCSSTRLDDVPAADTFSVEDMLSVQQTEGGATIEITFEVKFLKTTMFRYLIDKSTTTEMTKWLHAFFEHVERKVDEFRKKQGPISVAASNNQSESNSGTNESRKSTVDQRNPAQPANSQHITGVIGAIKARAASAIWGAWILIFMALVSCAWQWNAVNVRLESLNSHLEDLSLTQARLACALERLGGDVSNSKCKA